MIWLGHDMIQCEQMDRVISLTSFEEDRNRDAWVEYWLTRSPEERLAEVERLRRQYEALHTGADQGGPSQRLQRILRVVEREEC